MKRLHSRAFVFGLAVALLSPAALADLNSKEKGKVRHAVIQLDQMVKRMDEAAKVGKERAEEKFSECDKRIETAKTDLAGLPASEPDVQAATTRLEELTRTLAAKRNELNAAEAARDADVQAFLKAVGDGKELEAEEAVFKDLFGINGFNGQPDDDLAAWPKARADFDAFETKYGALAQKVGKTMAAQKGWIPYNAAKDAYARLNEERKELLKDGPGRVQQFIAEAKKQNASLATVQSNFVGIQMSVERALGNGDRVAITYDTMCKDLPGYQPGLRESIKKVEQELDSQALKYAEKIIAENQPKKTTYNGSDRSQLDSLIRAAWAKEYPQEKILAVRFDGDWSRAAGYRWEESGLRWVKYDRSSITFTVYVQGKEAKYAIAHGAAANKDHLNGDKVTAGAYDRAAPNRLVPSRTVLVTKL